MPAIDMDLELRIASLEERVARMEQDARKDGACPKCKGVGQLWHRASGQPLLCANCRGTGRKL